MTAKRANYGIEPILLLGSITYNEKQVVEEALKTIKNLFEEHKNATDLLVINNEVRLLTKVNGELQEIVIPDHKRIFRRVIKIFERLTRHINSLQFKITPKIECYYIADLYNPIFSVTRK